MEADDLAWLAERLQPATLPAGHRFLSPGSFPDCLTFVLSGRVRIEAVGESIPEDQRVLAEIVAGESFPLEALHETRPVFSTFRAAGPTDVLNLGVEDFRALQARSMVFRDFCTERAAAFLDSSRRIFTTHFSRHSDAALTLASPLGSLRLRRPTTCPSATPLRAALAQLAQAGDENLVIRDDGPPSGTFSLADLLHRVVLPGLDLDQPIANVMTAAPPTLPATADGYMAAQLMTERGLRQVLVVEHGRLLGAVTERDLFAAEHLGLGQLSDRIGRAETVDTLAVLADDIRRLTERLLGQGLAAEPLTRMFSSLNDRLTERAIRLCLAEQAITDIDFCWIALGSEGRHEQTLHTDQDNAIIFADGGDCAATREKLLPFAERVNAALARCGFPLCKGGVMAGNPAWCLSLGEWQALFRRWIAHPSPEAILNASIFFDFRALYGNRGLAEALSATLLACVADQNRFLHNLAAEALKRTPPIGFFRDFVVDQDAAHPGTTDLKLYAATLFVDAARLLALRHGVAESSTAGRLRQAAARMRLGSNEAEAWIDAYHYVQMLRLRRQCDLVAAGQPAHNRIDPYELNALDRKVFLEALRQARHLQKRIEMDFTAH
jgi:CBS domain-containing protein